MHETPPRTHAPDDVSKSPAGTFLPVVTIDGPAGSGKSTLARHLAEALGWRTLDTGAIYRSLALLARRRGVAWDDEAGLAAACPDLDLRFDGARVFLGDEEVTRAIRDPEMSLGASLVAAHPLVRRALLPIQRAVARQQPCVAEGRDTGTVVFPDAAAKFFLTACLEERALRRQRQLAGQGVAADLAVIMAEEEARDRRDQERAASPLRKADDAMEIDSTGMDLDSELKAMLTYVRDRLAATGL